MAGALLPPWAALPGPTRGRPRLLVLACNASPSDRQPDASGDAGEASGDGSSGEGVAPPRLATPGRAHRRRRRSFKRKKAMAGMQASYATKVDQVPKTVGTAVVEEGVEAASPSNPSNGNGGAPVEELEPLELTTLRRDGEESLKGYEPFPSSHFQRLPSSHVTRDERPDGEPAATAIVDHGTSVNKHGRLANDPNDMCVLPKPIFVISDCTGESAANTVRAALGQFENCFKTSVPANLKVFRFLRDENKIKDIVQRAATEEALIVFTLVDYLSVTTLRKACAYLGVSYVDLWSNLLDNMEKHLDTIRSGLPLGSPQRTKKLSDDYFNMIEAVEFTRNMDDGACPHRWHEADLLLLGVSRSGKTPLSIYLGQRGYKVANLPLVKGIPVPKQLYEIDQSKIFALILAPKELHTIRQTRLNSLGVGSVPSSATYAGLKSVQEELDYAWSLYKQNDWPVLDVTHSGVEETAARILKIMTDRSGHTHPLWRLPVE